MKRLFDEIMSHFQACLNCVNTGRIYALKNFPRCSKIPVPVCKLSQDGVPVSTSVSCFKGPWFKVEEFPCLVHTLFVILTTVKNGVKNIQVGAYNGACTV
jgi:hypothetical protein